MSVTGTGVSDPPIYEKVLHKRLVQLLRLYQDSHDFLFFHVKNDVGARRDRFFHDLKPMGVLPGVADFCIVKQDEVVFLEIKTLKGRLSDNQKRFLEKVSRLGHRSYVAYGWEDIVEKVERILGKGDGKHD